MKKRIFAALLAAMLIATSFVGCKKQADESSAEQSDVSVVDEATDEQDETDTAEEEKIQIPESEVAKFDALIEEEYAEELNKADYSKEYKYTSNRQANALLKANDRYYLIIDEYDAENSLFAATVYCRSTGDDSLLWQKSYGENNITSIPAAVVTSDGGIVLAGATSSTKGRFADIKNDRDNTAIIIKLDKNGNEQWLKTWDDLDHESFSRAAITSNDDVIVSASCASDEGNYGALRCYDKKGELKWDYKFGEDVTSAPGLIVINEEKGEISVVGIHDTSSFETGYYISRFDMKGSPIGDMIELGSYSSISISSMKYISDSEVVIGGRYYDENYEIGSSAVSHEEEHEGTADLSYNRYAPAYVFSYDLEKQQIGWEYKSYGYMGASASNVWVNDGTVNAIVNRYATQLSTPNGNTFGGDSILVKLSTDGKLISREAIKNSSVEENDETFMTVYVPDGDSFFALTEEWPED